MEKFKTAPEGKKDDEKAKVIKNPFKEFKKKLNINPIDIRNLGNFMLFEILNIKPIDKRNLGDFMLFEILNMGSLVEVELELSENPP